MKKIAESRDKILALDLFGTVTIAPEPSAGKSAIVPMVVRVSEKEPREIRFGIGYGTEDRFRTQFEWRHNNWLGDGRRLSILAKYSSLESSGAITFIQPYLFSPNSRGVVSLRHDRDDEDTYLLQATRFNPRLEYRFSEHLSSFLAYRLEYNDFSKVSAATESALGGVKKKGLASGPSLGLTWNTADNLLNPSQGEVVNFTLDQSGDPWGGEYRFYRASVRGRSIGRSVGKQSWPAGSKSVLPMPSARKKICRSRNAFTRGVKKSVRGYARRQLGPKNSSNDPIGGLSLLDGSVELRRPLWQALGGALFVDFGQVSRRAFDVPVSTLKFAAGFGLSYLTPVGPVRVDFGFPFAPARGDRAYPVFFSIGASF